MIRREPRKGFVIVSVELPRHLADLLAERRTDFIEIIELLGRECRHLPRSSEVQEEADQLRRQKDRERRENYKKFGRAGYRLYRHRIRTDGYQKSDGEFRGRSAPLSKAQWRCIVFTDIAEELSVHRDFIEFAISRFRVELLNNIKPRRRQAIIRLYLEGLRNREIADRVSVSITTIDRFLRSYREAHTGESC